MRENRLGKDYADLISRTRAERPGLAELLTRFPKGADLHNHLSGTVMPEDYIALGSAEGDCFGPDPKTPAMYTIASATAPGLCASGFKPLAQADSAERQRLVQSLSMDGFNATGTASIQSGHDQFFATFGRFGAVSGAAANTPLMLAKLLQQAHAEHVGYVETMMSFQSKAVSRLADLLRQSYPDPAAFDTPAKYPGMVDALIAMGLNDAVAAARKDVAAYAKGVKSVLGCGTRKRDPACDVALAFQAAVNRNSSLPDGQPDLPKIFTQTALSFLLADSDPLVVGVNLLSGEDASVSMQSYPVQMQFFGYFHHTRPGVDIALHGGEITPCFVGKDNPALKGHLTDSIRAGAKRLGHAVSFTFLDEADKKQVADLMKRNQVLVELPLTSNAQILGVAADEHPFPQYLRRYRVPAALATDDAGVSHADFTDEWVYAVGQYRLTYPEAVRLARSSLQYSFIPGRPLWQDVSSATPVRQCAGEVPGSRRYGRSCRAFLAGSERARMQWRHEAQLARFDKEYGGRLKGQLGD